MRDLAAQLRALTKGRTGQAATEPSPANLRAAELFPEDLKPSRLVRRYREVPGPTDRRSRRERRPALVRAARAERDALRGGGQA